MLCQRVWMRLLVPTCHRVLLATSIYHLTNDAAVTVLAGQLALLQLAFHLDPFETGALVGTAFLVSAVCQLLLGVLSDRLNPSTTLSFGLAILGMASVLVSISTGFVTLLLTIAVARIGASFYHPVGLAWIGRTFRTGPVDRPMGIQSSLGDAGVILGLATGAFLGVQFGWGAPFILWGAVNLIAAGCGVVFAPKMDRLAPLGHPWSWNEFRGAFNGLRIWILPICAGYACYSILGYFGPILLHVEFGLGVTASGVAVALWILAGAVGSFYFGRMSRYLGRYRIVLASFAFAGLASLVAACSGNAYLVLAALWSLGSAVFLTFPGVFSFASESGHAHTQGTTFGLVFSFQLVGGGLSSFLAGALGQYFMGVGNLQLTIPFVVSAAFAFGGCAYLGLVRKRLSLHRTAIHTT